MERKESNYRPTDETAAQTAGGSSDTTNRNRPGMIGKLTAKLGKLRTAYRRQSIDRRRAIVSVGIILTALLLFAVALIVGVSACVKHRSAPSLETAAALATDAPAQSANFTEPDPEPVSAVSETNESLPESADGAVSEVVIAPEPTAAVSEVVIAPEPTAEPLILKKHDERPEVMELQKRLIKLGYLEIDEPTEYFGSATEYAVKLFQRQHELEQDGVAGVQTLELIYSDDAQKYTLKEGAEGRDVKMLQEQLVDLGYMSSKEADSIYGAVTTEAVMAFQKRNKLTADGKAGEKTLDKLYSDDAKVSESLASKQKAEAEEAARKEKEAAAKQKEADKKAQQEQAKESRIDKFIAAATSKLGCEYVLGGRGPNTFDCSGFVYWCLRQAGVSTTRLNAAGYSKKSGWKEITSYSKLQKGDILFFRSDESSRVSHTGIYIGGGMMIDASSGNGKVVKRAVSSYWKRNLVNARRPW